MTAPRADQVVISLNEPSFGFDDKGAVYHVSHAGTYATPEYVDPAPGYAHNRDLVLEELAHLQRVAPISVPLAIFLLGHEVTSRTNGHCSNTRAWIRDASGDRDQPVSIIVLSGKRIPIHPAMTRYLVAHEYGHAVEEELRRRRSLKDFGMRDEYLARVRPTASKAYGCGRWHAAVGELFANDFRILVAKREVEFWPHEGFERPEQNLAVVGFWAQAAAELTAEETNK